MISEPDIQLEFVRANARTPALRWWHTTAPFRSCILAEMPLFHNRETMR
jgi:hypothetical protein